MLALYIWHDIFKLAGGRVFTGWYVDNSANTDASTKHQNYALGTEANLQTDVPASLTPTNTAPYQRGVILHKCLAKTRVPRRVDWYAFQRIP